MTWNSMKLKSVKKNNFPYPVKSLGNIKCNSLSNPRPVKTPSNSIKYNCQKISSWLGRPKIILEIKKKYDHSSPFIEHRMKIYNALDLFETFLNTGTSDENFQQSGKQDFFRHLFS